MAVYACSDLHGMYQLYEKIKRFLKPDDVVYFLGDAVDRGPNSFKLFKAIYYDPQFRFIKGNHEDMFYEALEDFERRGNFAGSRSHLHRCNGGMITWEQWINDGADLNWGRKILGLPERLDYINKDNITVCLTHAGFTPGSNHYDYIWDRKHFDDDMTDELCKDVMIVHGHTPWCYLTGEDELSKPHIVTYGDGHKIDIDCGSFFSGVAALLNLDTFEPIYFNLT